MKVAEYRKIIKDRNLTNEFSKHTGTYLSKATKTQIVNFYDAFIKNDSPAVNIPNLTVRQDIPKLKEHKPDVEKLNEIRKELNNSEVKIEKLNDPEELQEIKIEQDEKDLLNQILNEREEEIEPEEPEEPEENNYNYEYNESCEIKISRYVELYPNLKEVNNSKNFNSSEEKLRYIENYINRSKSGANLSNYIFIATSYLESNQIVNNYIKLEGYTKNLIKRKEEIEECIQEIKIKYMDEIGEYLDMPPEGRLGLIMLEQALHTHMANIAIMEARKEQLLKNMK